MSAAGAHGGAVGVPLADLSPLHRLRRVRHELQRRHCTVRRVEVVSPGFVRVQLFSDALRSFTSLSFDDHVKVFLPPSAGLPADAAPAMRDFTPRAFDNEAGTLDIEFALHGHGPASRWAAAARPGDTLDIGGPRGSMIVPTDFDWHLLAGDESALPAMARRLQELPAAATATVLVALRDPADRRALSSRAQLSVHWLDARQPGALAEAARTWPVPAGEGFAWAAGEAAEVAALRHVLLGPLGLHKARVRASAYWKLGRDAHHEALES
jgi:NADPH-dependent ferric siderophore reductase